MNEFILQIHEDFPVSFFIRPEGEYTTKFSDWHRKSLERVPKDVIPHLSEYFNKSNVKEGNSAIWILYHVINFIEPSKLSFKDMLPLRELINSSFGYDDFIDNYIIKILGNILELMLENEKKEFLQGLSSDILSKLKIELD